MLQIRSTVATADAQVASSPLANDSKSALTVFFDSQHYGTIPHLSLIHISEPTRPY